MINIAEILKVCPKGIKLYSPICGDCTYTEVNEYGFITVMASKDISLVFNKCGQYFTGFNSECLLFPSKDNRDWNTFRPWTIQDAKNGDVIFYDSGWTCIFKRIHGIWYSSYCFITSDGEFYTGYEEHAVDSTINGNAHPATKEQCKLLFQKMKEAGYKWNVETKTLEKLVELKFKVGDKIVKKNGITKPYIVNSVSSDYYGLTLPNSTGIAVLNVYEQDEWELAPVPKFKVGDIVETKRNKSFDYKIIKITDTHYTLESIPGANTYDILICEDENWKLVPKKFDISNLKAYDKVLVRDTNVQVWVADLFSHVLDKPLGGYTFACVGHYYYQCIPYEGNEHLLGTCDDCGEYYKNW